MNFLIPLTTLVLLVSYVHCGEVLELGNSNFEASIKRYEVVMVNFYASWCKFSRMLDPVWEESAQLISKLFPDAESVKLVKVDSEKESDVARKYNINKYPTIKLFKSGKVQKREYRGSRTKEAIAEFVKKQLESPVKEIPNLDDIQDLLDKSKHNIIGYFDSKETPEYKQFDKVANILRDDCGWFSAFGEVAQSQKPAGGFQIIYKPPNTEHGEKLFQSSLKSHELLLVWAHDKCVPLVRQINFENAEELTEEGIPFLILFHKPDDTETPKKYTEVVQKHLFTLKDSITFLTADGVQFAHPLHHMGKQVKDLPVLAIDSFKHMYVYPDNKDKFDPASLKEFIQDLFSGKLHREFHHGPDAIPVQVQQKTATVPSKKGDKVVQPPPKAPASKLGAVTTNENMFVVTTADNSKNQDQKTPPGGAVRDSSDAPAEPVESQFVKLAPSDLRYSFKYRDEL